MAASRPHVVRLAGVFVAIGILLTGARAAAQGPSRPERLGSVNAGLQLISDAFMNSSPYTLHGEVGRFEVHYDFTKAFAADTGIAWHVAGRFAMGFTVSYIEKATTAEIEATVPHPFFFAFPRPATGTARGVKRREMGVHFQPQYWHPVSDRLLLRVYGGPTIFLLRQALVSGILTEEIGVTFHQVRIADYRSRGAGGATLGLNGGVEGSYLVTDRLGIGFGLRWSRGTKAVDVQGRVSTPVELGGLHFGGGLRVAF